MTYYLVTNFWNSKPYIKPVTSLAAAVEAFNTARQRKGVRRVIIGTDANLSGIILDSWAA